MAAGFAPPAKYPMSDSAKAVFLSYASQDAPAVERIAEALRAAGVEVWFDKDELVGGDAWDQKIRRQIKDCALLIPVISANTQARTEGYFRLEWRLADQRTHLMAKGRAFLLPVVIDDTRDTEAHVPDSFTEVQWTRLPGGEASGAFAARVKQLLGGAEREAGRPRPAERVKVTAPPKKSFRPWLVAVIIVAAILAGVWQQQRNHTPVPVLPAAKSGSRPEVAQILERVRGLTGRTDVLRTELDTATDLLGQAAKLDNADAAVWAEWALVDCRYVDEDYDTSAARLDAARRHAAQATALDPKAPQVRFVQARVMLLLAGNPPTRVAAEKILRPLLAEVRDQGPVLLELGWLAFERTQPEAALEWFDRAVLVQGYAGRAHFAKALAFFYAGLLANAQEELDRALQSEQAAKFFLWKAYLLSIWEGDIAAASRMLEQIPPGVFVEDMSATTRYMVTIMAGDYDQALASIRAVPHDYLQSRADTGPSGYFKGYVLALAGKPAAAELEWRSGLAVVERRLAAEPNDYYLMTSKVLLQVALGDRAAALPTWKALQELYGQSVEANPDLQMQMLPPEGALAWVAGRITQGSPMVTAARLRLEPVYAPVRSLPGFSALLARAEADPRLSPHAKGASPEKSAATSKADDKSVAVLAFANLSDEKAGEYFSDGISEELLNVLAKVPGLKVSARTSAFYFKGKNLPIPEIAAKLNVAYVVEGSVQRAGERVKITAQLIKAADGFHLWSDTFTRDAKDVFAVQEEIAGLIAKQLSLKLGASSAAATAAINPQAFEFYVRAREAWKLRTLADYDRAEDLLNRALALEPNFARAHSALADVWFLRAQDKNLIGSFAQRGSPEFARIKDRINQALALDPELAEAHTSLGGVAWVGWDSPTSERELRRAIALNPNYATAHQWLGRTLNHQGRLEEGLAELKLATELDPLASRILDNYSFGLSHAGRYAEAIAYIDRALALQPNAVQARIFKVGYLLSAGRVAEAVDLARTLPIDQDAGGRAAQGVALARAGRKAEAAALLAGFSTTDEGPKMVLLLALGRMEEAIALVKPESMFFSYLENFLFDPNFDPIRRDPRFVRLLADLGATEAHARAQAWRAAHPLPKTK